MENHFLDVLGLCPPLAHYGGAELKVVCWTELMGSFNMHAPTRKLF
jgi:hypothetical protein